MGEILFCKTGRGGAYCQINMGRAYRQNGKRQERVQNFTGKPTGKEASGNSRCSWEDNIIFHPKAMDVRARNWVDSAQDKDYWNYKLIINIVADSSQVYDRDNI